MNLSISPDRHAKGFADVPEALRYDGHTDDPHEVAGIMRRLMPEGARVLDVGCGTGSLTLIVNHAKGNTVVALEPDAERAAEARRRGLDVVNGELDEAFLAERGPFDAIIFADVLEHLPSPASVLETAVKALAPEGMVLISVPNVAHWSVRANLLVGRFDYEPVGIMDATHLRWFTEASLRRIVKESGLEVIGVEQAAGLKLPVYWRSIFQFMPRAFLDPAVRSSVRLLPRLFGSQHVVVARKTQA